jgi:NAD(P)-dependent dehydrogenase (short-subunit alcohol dehydrogenase family)
MGAPIDQVTVDGYDMTWGTNALGKKLPLVIKRACVLSAFCKPGPFYFTTLLLPALFKASTPENKSRVVNTSSAGGIYGVSLFGSGLDFATFKDSPHKRKYNTGELYNQSKLVRPTITDIESVDKSETFQSTRGTLYSPRNWPGAMVVKS